MSTQWAPATIDEEGVAMPIGERIKELRKERAWSQAELGEKVGTDSQRISRYENGRLTPSLAAAVRIAEALDVSVDYLVIEGASRRSLTDADSTLAARLAELGALDDADRDAVLHIIDGLIAKNRVRHALSDAS